MRLVLVVIAAAACSTRGSAKPAADDGASAWSSVTIGSVFESRTVTASKQPVEHQTVTTMKQTLVAKDAAHATLELEIVDGAKHTTQDVKVPLRHEAPPSHDGSTVTTTAETCTVPAGTFDCTKTIVEIRDGDATRSTETWMASRIPVPLKSIVSNQNLTITTELTRVSAARPQ